MAKAGTWYLVADNAGHKRVYRVSRIVEVTQSTGKFNRPSSYNLLSFWVNWCQKHEARRTYFRVTARINPRVIPHLIYILGDQLQGSINHTQPPDKDGWLTIELTFESFEAARNHMLSCGRAVEILEPEALRMSVIDYAEQIIDMYSRTN